MIWENLNILRFLLKGVKMMIWKKPIRFGVILREVFSDNVKEIRWMKSHFKRSEGDDMTAIEWINS